MNSTTNIADSLVLFVPSGKRGQFPVGTPLPDATHSLRERATCGFRMTERLHAAILQIDKPQPGGPADQ